MSTIVVGVDGSEGAVEALKFALNEAKLRQAELKVVSAWHVPPAAYGAGWSLPVFPEEFRKIATTALNGSLEAAGTAESGVSVTSVVREGHPADVLRDEAAGAEILVVGSRGLGGFKEVLLGSVSQHCAQHAPCPVIIVPHTAE